jgi:hypothetical protein
MAVAVHIKIKHDLPDHAAALEQHEALIDGVGRKREGLEDDRCELGAPRRLGAVGHGCELLKVFSIGVGQDECGVSLLPAHELAKPHCRLAVDSHVLWPALPARRRQPRPPAGPVVLARTWLGFGLGLGFGLRFIRFRVRVRVRIGFGLVIPLVVVSPRTRVGGGVVHHIVVGGLVREALRLVVDHPGRALRPDHLRILTAGDADDLSGAERLGNLHAGRATAAGGANHQHLGWGQG